MSTRKYEHLTGASRATASRDLLELAEFGMLVQQGAGRGTRYELRLLRTLGAGAEPIPRR